jgi:hypothetical protein
VNAWFAVAGEATMLVGWLEPPDNASSLLIGPRLTTWRVFGQVLMGHQWHQVFPDGLVVQPGAGIDVWHVRMQVDYGYFEPIPRLSGVRYQVAYVARFGSLTRR